MKVQDFFSIVQLGVGIHAGTAILQLSGEFGITQIERRIENITLWLQEERADGNALTDLEEDLKDIRTSIYVFKTQYSNVYRRLIGVTFGSAFVLLLVLSVMSFSADADISNLVALTLVLFSFTPALITFIYLWRQSTMASAPIQTAVRRMEAAIRAPRPRL